MTNIYEQSLPRHTISYTLQHHHLFSDKLISLTVYGYRPWSSKRTSTACTVRKSSVSEPSHSHYHGTHQSRHVEPTTRQAYCSPVNMVPKPGDSRKMRLVVDMSHLTASFPRLRMRIPPFTVYMRDLDDLPDLRAVTGSMRTARRVGKRLTTFKHDGRYYRFTCLPMELLAAAYGVVCAKLEGIPTDRLVWSKLKFKRFPHS